ncbi:antA/AntB antirepressor family protein [Lentilactobacillus kisonensis]|uniref:antA/AntB antirepressor family protein n=1 Tax=Lentilactobacillus kisonensis TaxID=481722 RepID=UPI0006D22300|nr:antA/AntB antirepressor family protein [Lentilactobacillus kisonensis]
MDQLIKILKHDDEMVVSGRDLHDFLEVDTPYRIWIQRMIEYGFHENADYISFEQKKYETSRWPSTGWPRLKVRYGKRDCHDSAN